MDSADESGGLGKGVIAAVAIGVLFLWALCWGLTIAILGKPTGPGQFGDMFGSVNALFSGLAFGGIVLTLLLQRLELALQRKELALTRDQLTRTAKAQEASEVALSRQAAAYMTIARSPSDDAAERPESTNEARGARRAYGERSPHAAKQLLRLLLCQRHIGNVFTGFQQLLIICPSGQRQRSGGRASPQ